VLQALKTTSESGQLSIKFNLDLYAMGGPGKTYGRIAGTIGPYRSGEPTQIVLGRHLVPNDIGNLYHSVCVVDPQRRKIIADIGNALPTKAMGWMISARSRSALPRTKASLQSMSRAIAIPIGISRRPRSNSFRKRPLTDEQLSAIERFPLVVFTLGDAGAPKIQSLESPANSTCGPMGMSFGWTRMILPPRRCS
jgi:hypothetical protein